MTLPFYSYAFSLLYLPNTNDFGLVFFFWLNGYIKWLYWNPGSGMGGQNSNKGPVHSRSISSQSCFFKSHPIRQCALPLRLGPYLEHKQKKSLLQFFKKQINMETEIFYIH